MPALILWDIFVSTELQEAKAKVITINKHKNPKKQRTEGRSFSGAHQ